MNTLSMQQAIFKLILVFLCKQMLFERKYIFYVLTYSIHTMFWNRVLAPIAQVVVNQTNIPSRRPLYIN
jgi:hypothetical protein